VYFILPYPVTLLDIIAEKHVALHYSYVKLIIIYSLLDQNQKIFVKIVTDLSNLNLNGSISKGTSIPLLLDCGHPICNKCINKTIKNCPLCNKIISVNNLNNKFLLPLNLYALGLIISSYHRPLENDDEEFLFCHKLSSQLRQITKQG